MRIDAFAAGRVGAGPGVLAGGASAVVGIVQPGSRIAGSRARLGEWTVYEDSGSGCVVESWIYAHDWRACGIEARGVNVLFPQDTRVRLLGRETGVLALYI